MENRLSSPSVRIDGSRTFSSRSIRERWCQVKPCDNGDAECLRNVFCKHLMVSVLLAHSLSRSLSLSPFFSLSLSLTHTHAHTCARIHMCVHSCTHTHTNSRIHTHTHTHQNASHTLPHIHTLSLFLTYTQPAHPYARACKHMCTHVYAHANEIRALSLTVCVHENVLLCADPRHMDYSSADSVGQGRPQRKHLCGNRPRRLQ